MNDGRKDERGAQFPEPCFWETGLVVLVLLVGVAAWQAVPAAADHRGHDEPEDVHQETVGPGVSVPGTVFRVFRAKPSGSADPGGPDPLTIEEAFRTVVDALTLMSQHRTDFPRFDEAMKKEALQAVIVEPKVVNRDGKEFQLLVARTKERGKVKLLVSAVGLKERELIDRPERLAPLLDREFQWVVSKADTAPKPQARVTERDLRHAPILADQDVSALSAEARARTLQQLFGTYLHTLDELKSLDGQPYYEIGSSVLIPPARPDSTTNLYDIRVRQALERIVREPVFLEQMPNAVRSLLNGKIWNVAFVKIDGRDWATRTRVLPDDRSILVGERERRIQPAQILVNAYRKATPDDPFYSRTNDLPMGALPPEQLAFVIALEIQHNIVEKSMSGHVAQDALTAPK
ncbi:MAG: hypothetical protein P0111_08695 [Nitrospira sp.]|nr:hypothetical protein [Nitrospira sp.]